ncbi:MAG: YhjD/YihY/BrkB family envelope integrity protein [Gammaproteobacteria bacterium]
MPDDEKLLHGLVDRGAQAKRPWHIPLRGWLDIFRRIRHEVLRDHIFLVSAGVAFLAILALLPILSALISIYGLVTSPQELQHQMHALGPVVPPGVIKVISTNLHGVTQHSGLALSFGIVVSILIALWVSVRGVMGIIGALNIVYDESENRSLPALIATASALALGALLFWIVALLLVVGT